MIQTMEKNGTEPYLKKFERFEKEASNPSWVFPLRKAGLSRFAEVGFPTLKDEDWRFTNVAPIAKLPFKPLFTLSKDGLTPEVISNFAFGGIPAYRLVFVDGHYLGEFSTAGEPCTGIRIKSMASALLEDSAFLQNHLGRYAQMQDNAFTALNTAYFQDGAFIHVPRDTEVEHPVHLLFISTGKEAG